MASKPRVLPRLGDFGFFWRFGIGVLAICLVGGYMVSGIYLYQHYENRDEQPGLTMTDIEGAYAGAVAESPLRKAIKRGHPEDLPADERAVLIEWLASDNVQAGFDDIDTYEIPPSDIILYGSCVECHAAGAEGEGAYPELPLEREDQILAIAVSREILPKDEKIVVQSLHAHAPSMAVCTMMLAVLAGMTRFARPIVGLVVAAAAVGLLADLSGQWLARTQGGVWTWAIVVGGFAASAGVGLLGLMVVLDAWLPGNRTKKPDVPHS